jgi:hypothetical protein
MADDSQLNIQPPPDGVGQPDDGETVDPGPGGENASVRAAVTTGTLLALAALLVLYALVQVWPPSPPPAVAGGTTAPQAGATTTTAPGVGTTAPTTTAPAGAPSTTTVVVQAAPNPPVRLLWAQLEVDREARLLLVVGLAGALGGLVHALRSLAWYAGNRNLKYSWMMTYYLQPVVGAGLATIAYAVLRGGLVLVTTQTSSDVVNPFGFAAIAALVGLFSAQAAEWLKRIFEQVFTSAPKGKDPAIEVRVTDINPEHGAEQDEITVTGTGFTDVQAVAFGGVEASDVRRVSDTELKVKVPAGARSGPITVKTPAGTTASTKSFTVNAPGGLPPDHTEAATTTK